MNYSLELSDSCLLSNVEAALKIVDPAAQITTDCSGIKLTVSATEDFLVRITLSGLPESDSLWEYQDRDAFDPRYNGEDRRQRLKELVRLGIITLVGKYLHKKPPWGILSGVRPTKIFHYLRDKGFSISEIRERLLTIYGLSPVKAGLLIEVGQKQESFFQPPNLVSVYLGIPFCPSRCAFCSFPAVSLQTHSHLVKKFLESLAEEIKATGELCRECGLRVETIYVGGGTPTSLDEESFDRVITELVKNFHSSATREFTVEAGRPETLTIAKIRSMINSGVSRICINPQTMNQRTLEIIGRNHTVDQVYQAVAQIRKYSGLDLNMDLIMGLPGESGAGFLQSSLGEIWQFEPENITIHTLAPKRASAWRKNFPYLKIAQDEELARTSETAVGILRDHGYHPYYLYRQRYILADQENIGFSITGKENIYNIQMMEERQTIFGLGAGAVTKWVTVPDYKIFRAQNPKCPATYCSRINNEMVKKAHQTRILLG